MLSGLNIEKSLMKLTGIKSNNFDTELITYWVWAALIICFYHEDLDVKSLVSGTRRIVSGQIFPF